MKIVAFHLPQFHPIPENDEWWGQGFTEWTNVARARPLFRGHHQPNVPADLGFYDLRLAETRELQAEYARRAGIHGFCYWHYWFGDGRRLLQRPVDEMLDGGSPDFPFMLGWANQTWTGVWHGASNRVLIEQRYPGAGDVRDHCRVLVRHFSDRRYIRVEGRPLFYIYDPSSPGFGPHYLDLYKRILAEDFGERPWFIVKGPGPGAPLFPGADASVHEPNTTARAAGRRRWDDQRRWLAGLPRRLAGRMARGTEFRGGVPRRYDYEKGVRALARDTYPDSEIPCILTNWDNTPRSGSEGWVAVGATPEAFGRHATDVLGAGRNGTFKDIVFLKSWNEWAEGNYMEPDQRFGDAYVRQLRRAVDAVGESTGVGSAVPGGT